MAIPDLSAGIFGGVLDSQHLRRLICDIHECYPPRVDYAMVLTDLLKLRPRIFPRSAAVVGMSERSDPAVLDNAASKGIPIVGVHPSAAAVRGR